MTDSLSIVVHAFACRMLMSVLVDETWLPGWPLRLFSIGQLTLFFRLSFDIFLEIETPPNYELQV